MPTLLSTRLGKWRLLHLIQEESKARDALPEEMTRARDLLSKSIARSVAEYEVRRDRQVRDRAWTLASTSLWVSVLLLILAENVRSDDPLDDPDTWAPLIDGFAGGIAIGAAVIAAVSIVGILLLLLTALTRFGPTRKASRWALRPLFNTEQGKRLRAWARARSPQPEKLREE